MDEYVHISCSMCGSEDNGYEVAVHYEDSNDIDIDVLNEGDSLSDIFEEAAKDLLSEYAVQMEENAAEALEEAEEDLDEEWTDNYIDDLEEMIEELIAENQSLKTDNEVLQKRVDNLVNKKYNRTVNVRKPYFSDLIYFLNR